MTYPSVNHTNPEQRFANGMALEKVGTLELQYQTQPVREVRTTDNAWTTIALVQPVNPVTLNPVPLPDERMLDVEVTVVGKGGAVCGAYHLEGTFYRTGGGNITLLGTVSSLHSAETDAGLDVQLLAAGGITQSVAVQVKGLAATTIDWRAVVRWIIN